MVDVAALQRENAELRGQVSELVQQLAKLNERVAELLAIAQRKQRKSPAEKPPVAPPSVEGDAKRAFDERPKAPEKPAEKENVKSPAKPTGRKSVPSHLEAEEPGLAESVAEGVYEELQELAERVEHTRPNLSIVLGRIVDALAVNAVGVLDVEVPLGRGVDMRVGRTAVNGVLILILLGIAAVAMSLRSRAGSN